MGYLSADYLATSDAFKRKDIESRPALLSRPR